MEKETQMYRIDFWTLGEGEGGMFRENSIKTSILSRVKQITSPGWMHETSAQSWCTGKTQRDGMGSEVGGEIGMGNTCKSMADSCQCMAKTTTIFQVISLQLIKINEEKKKESASHHFLVPKEKKKKLGSIWDKRRPLYLFFRAAV